jgi:hypothetical protein
MSTTIYTEYPGRGTRYPMKDILIDHAGHTIQIDIRGTSGAVALDCDDCGSTLILAHEPDRREMSEYLGLESD